MSATENDKATARPCAHDWHPDGLVAFACSTCGERTSFRATLARAEAAEAERDWLRGEALRLAEKCDRLRAVVARVAAHFQDTDAPLGIVARAALDGSRA